MIFIMFPFMVEK